MWQESQAVAAMACQEVWVGGFDAGSRTGSGEHFLEVYCSRVSTTVIVVLYGAGGPCSSSLCQQGANGID